MAGFLLDVEFERLCTTARATAAWQAKRDRSKLSQISVCAHSRLCLLSKKIIFLRLPGIHSYFSPTFSPLLHTVVFSLSSDLFGRSITSIPKRRKRLTVPSSTKRERWAPNWEGSADNESKWIFTNNWEYRYGQLIELPRVHSMDNLLHCTLPPKNWSLAWYSKTIGYFRKAVAHH